MSNSIYWPGTKIPKSNGNAFDWKSLPSRVPRDTTPRLLTSVPPVPKLDPVHVYSRAKPSKSNEKTT